MNDTPFIKKGRFTALSVALMFLLPIATAFICLCVGRMSVPLGDVIRAIRSLFTGETAGVQNYSIIVNLRLPRILMAIVVGAGLIPLALIGSAMIGLILWIFASRKTHQSPYMLILRLTDENSETAAMELVSSAADKAIVKAKTVTPGSIELSCEVRLKDGATTFVNQLSTLNGVESAALVSYNGEYMS